MPNPSASPRITSTRISPLLMGAILAFLSVTVFLPMSGNGFIRCWDDSPYVLDNPHVLSGPTADNLRWALTSIYAANWHPLTWISHQVDSRLYGLNPGGHHLTSLFLHTANVVLLFTLLVSMTGTTWSSALVAALFALHPTHVESVAQIAERKDVLSTFFGLLALLAYVRYARGPSAVRYLPVVALLAAGLMSKPMLVTWPFVMLLLDIWPLRRMEGSAGRHYRVARLLLEKTPLLVLSAAVSCMVFLAQQGSGAVASVAALSLTSRISGVIVAYVKYCALLLNPTRLAVFYPRPEGYALATVLAAGLFLLLLTSGAIAFRRTKPWFMFGWFWFLGTLVPVIGLVQVGTQEIADRYTYIPAIGFFVILVWGLAALVHRVPKIRLAVITGSVCACAMCAILTWKQVHRWKDDVTLFSQAVQNTNGNYVAHGNLGIALCHEGAYGAGIGEYAKAIAANPGYCLAYANVAKAFLEFGRADSAQHYARQALACSPLSAAPRLTLGLACAVAGDTVSAEREYLAAIAVDSSFWEAWNNLGALQASLGRSHEAKGCYFLALRIRPDAVNPRMSLARMLLSEGAVDSAVLHLRKLAAYRERDPVALCSIGRLLDDYGQVHEAKVFFEKALAADTGNEEVKALVLRRKR